jgi:hypothetical protein
MPELFKLMFADDHARLASDLKTYQIYFLMLILNSQKLPSGSELINWLSMLQKPTDCANFSTVTLNLMNKTLTSSINSNVFTTTIPEKRSNKLLGIAWLKLYRLSTTANTCA